MDHTADLIAELSAAGTDTVLAAVSYVLLRHVENLTLLNSLTALYATGNAEDSYALGKEEYALQQTALAWWAGAVPSGPGFKLDKSKVTGVNLNPTGAVA